MRILIADNQPKVRRALRVLLEQAGQVQIVGEAANAPDLLARMETTATDLVLLDGDLPGLAMVELLPALRRVCPEVQVIALSARPEAGPAALAAGADAFVSKADPAEHLLGAIEECSLGQPIPPFDWFANQFTLESRRGFIEQISPHLTPLLKPGDCVLDLCCGAGPIAFFLEEQGARVTAIDFAPSLIAMARQEASQRGSGVNFIQANVLTHPLGDGVYDLAVCFGNAILEFPHQSFPAFRDRVFHALKPGGRFVVEYIDGLLRVAYMSEPAEVVEQGVDSQVVRRFKGYDPATSTYRMEYRRLSSNETYEHTGYIYTGPLIRIAMERRFKFVRSIQLEGSFMDVYVKRQRGGGRGQSQTKSP